MLGIQRFTFEGRVSCGIDWYSREESHYVYKIVIFATAFVIPLTIMTCNHLTIFVVVSFPIVNFMAIET